MVIARSYLAALMPDFRYRQTTALLDVHGHAFRAVGRQPIEIGWRAAFRRGNTLTNGGNEAQLLPPLRDGEKLGLSGPKVETKETKPPPRYNEGTLIEAMENAWRFVDDEVRGTAEGGEGDRHAGDAGRDHRGPQEQDLLMARASISCRPSVACRCSASSNGRSGASRSRGDGAARMFARRGLDRQAGDGRCDRRSVRCRPTHHWQAQGRRCPRKDPGAWAAAVNGAAAYPPTPAMKRFADSVVRQKGIKPPPGYKTSGSICRKFLNDTRPRKPTVKRLESLNPNRPVRPSCRTPRGSRGGKASSFPTRPRPVRPPCPRGLNSNEAVSAAATATDHLQAVLFATPHSAGPTERSRLRHGRK